MTEPPPAEPCGGPEPRSPGPRESREEGELSDQSPPPAPHPQGPEGEQQAAAPESAEEPPQPPYEYDAGTALFTREGLSYHWDPSKSLYVRVRDDLPPYAAPLQRAAAASSSSPQPPSSSGEEAAEVRGQQQERGGSAWELDETVGMYYNSVTAMHYDAASGLHYDLGVLPSVVCHYAPSTAAFLVVVTPDGAGGDQAGEEAGEGAQVPPVLLLRVRDLMNDTVVAVVAVGDPGEHPPDECAGAQVVPEVVFSRDPPVPGHDAKPHRRVVALGRTDVSKRHARVAYERVFWDNVFWVADLGSTNGTTVNGLRLSPSKEASADRSHCVRPGDVIGIASFEVTVDAAPPPSSVARSFQPSEARPEEPQQPEEEGPNAVDLLRRSLKRLSPAEMEHRRELGVRYENRASRRRDMYHGADQFQEPEPEEVPQPPPAQRQRRTTLYGDGAAQSGASAAPSGGAGGAQGDAALGGDNRGFQMMLKMGWRKGAGLGSNESGRVDPLAPQGNGSRRGLGFP
eukprot:m51a1_g5440 hypothetical protein (513) ;mRNA; r:178882-180420